MVSKGKKKFLGRPLWEINITGNTTFAEKCTILPKSNFSWDLSAADMDLIYFVVKITGVKNVSISNRRLSLGRITLTFF